MMDLDDDAKMILMILRAQSTHLKAWFLFGLDVPASLNGCL